MEKDYKRWMTQKARINNERQRPDKYIEGGIYWAYLGENVGREQDGRGSVYARPVLVLRGFGSDLAMCVPISHTMKKSQFYFPINIRKVRGSILLSQMRPLDTLRFNDLIATVPNKMLLDIKHAIAKMLLK